MNHTLLTSLALQHAAIKAFTRTLMRVQEGDSSVSSNRRILAELLAPNPVFAIGFLSRNTLSLGGLKEKSKKTEKTLARILACGNLSAHRSLRERDSGGEKKLKKVFDSRRDACKLMEVASKRPR